MSVWEDREVKFDIPNIQTKLRGGEKILDAFDYVEDNKGNIGDRGRLLITNLRLIWYSLSTSRFSLSVGFLCVLTLTLRAVMSKIRGRTHALYVLTVFSNQRYEFIFTDMQTNKVREFESVFEIYRLYQSTYLYRELKLRGAIVSNGQLNILPQEQVYNTISGVWNLSSDQGNLGTFIISNIRLIWFADINDTFNISLPHMQISNIKVRESKYGPALVIQTKDSGGGYVLGFRIDPFERLENFYKELTSLYTVYSENPIFGVIYDGQIISVPLKPNESESVDQIEEIDDKKTNEISYKLSAYLAEGVGEFGTSHAVPFYCKDLGFSMEKIKDGYTLKDLWNVLT